MKDVLVTDSLLDDLAREVGKLRWRKLGTVLGFPDTFLTTLTHNHRTNACRAKEMLYAWKKKLEGNATEEALKNALKEASMSMLWKKCGGKHSKDAVCTDICIP